MEQQFDKFIKGFNHGYILAEYEPDLLKRLLNGISPITEYLEGIISGKDEFQKEFEITQLKEIENLRSQHRDQEREL